MTRDTRTPDRAAATGAPFRPEAPAPPGPRVRLTPAAADHRISPLAGADGTPLALHSWRPVEPTEATTLLFYVHGIQSHAGWYDHTCTALSRAGYQVYFLDRRGEGGGVEGRR